MKMKNSPLADTVVIKFIEILEEHQRRCNQQKEFKEAEEIKCHIKELKNQERNRRKEVLHCKQILEKLDVENAHKIELDEFYLKWNEKLNDHDLSSRAELSLNESRHTSEIEMKAKTLFASHKLPKPSTELLRLKHLVRTHAKQKNFEEADKCKTRATVLEARDAIRWLGEEEAENAALVEQWRAVKKNELMVLESRFRTVRDELVCQMRNELDTLQLRFKSIKAELEAQHSLERAQLSKVFQTELALVPIPNVKT